ncbi:MAG: hypothetical protein AAF845_06450 [Bacteroidota bacterium]
MGRPALRRLQIGAVRYLWRVHHRHHDHEVDGVPRCTEVFTAFQGDYPRRPVRMTLAPSTPSHPADSTTNQS